MGYSSKGMTLVRLASVAKADPEGADSWKLSTDSTPLSWAVSFSSKGDLYDASLGLPQGGGLSSSHVFWISLLPVGFIKYPFVFKYTTVH